VKIKKNMLVMLSLLSLSACATHYEYANPNNTDSRYSDNFSYETKKSLQKNLKDQPVISKTKSLSEINEAKDNQSLSMSPARKNLIKTWQRFFDISINDIDKSLVTHANYDRNFDVTRKKEEISDFLRSLSPLYCLYKYPERMNSLLNDLMHAWDIGELEKLQLINKVNKLFDSASDIQVWGKNEYWATVCETLAKGLGDCEQYAMLKYSLAEAMGISERKIRLGVVKTPAGEGHLVLLYFPTQLYSANPMPVNLQEALVLDNRNSSVRRFNDTEYDYPKMFMTL
jgi:predicted transglutaminase-like cysteine proteinase